MYAEDVVAQEYRQLGFFRRLVLRWVSPDMARAARHLAANQRAYVNVPVKGKAGPGPITKAVDNLFAGSSR